MLEKTPESPLDCKEIQPVSPKGNQSLMFTGRTDAEAEAPILWPPDAKSWLIGKDPDAGRDWGQEEKGTTEDEMAGWHHRLNGHEFEWTPGVGDGREAWRAVIHGVTKSRTRLSNWTELNWATELNWKTKTAENQINKRKQISISRWMDREEVIHIYNEISPSHKKNEFESVVLRWMNLEPLI